MMKNSIYTCLWFDRNAFEAATYYCSVFRDSEILSVSHLVVRFKVNGFEFMGLNGGPQFKFSEATSFVVECDTQEEIDYYWMRLTDGGEESMCGWLKDRYGVSWQIVPSVLSSLMSDVERGPRVMQAFLKMKKFDIQTLLNC